MMEDYEDQQNRLSEIQEDLRRDNEKDYEQNN